MTRKFVPLLAATFLSISWASEAQAATSDESNKSAAASTVVAVAETAQGTAPKKAVKGLCARLGGVFGIAAVVNRFSDAIIVNPVLNQNPALVAWNQNEAPTRLPGLKVGRTIWIASKVGCQIKFTGLALEDAHERLNLTAAEFNEVGAEIVRALQFFQVAQSDIDELVRIYGTSMNDVVSSGEGPTEVTPSQ